MRFISALLFLMLLTLARADNTINVLVNTRDLTSQPLARRNVTITPSAPLSRTLYTNIFSREPRTQATSASGSTTFSNVAWGYYWLDIGSPVGTPPNQFTRFGLVIGANSSGTVSAHLLTTNNAILPPTPAAYYYTTNEVDALISAGSGSATNVYRSVGAGGIVVSTNGLLFTISNAVPALTNYDSRAVVFGSTVTAAHFTGIFDGPGYDFFDTATGFIQFSAGNGSGLTNLPFTGLSDAGKLAVTNAVNTQLEYYTATNSASGAYIANNSGVGTNTTIYGTFTSAAEALANTNAAATVVTNTFKAFSVATTTNVSTAANLIAAINFSARGSVVGIMPGTYSIGTNNLVPPEGVSVIGAGSTLVNIIGYADCWGVESYSTPSGGPQFSPGDNQLIQGFTLTCDTNTMNALPWSGPGVHSHMWSGFGMSAKNPPANRSFTNVYVRDVVVSNGYFDCFHFNPNTNRVEVTFENCGGIAEGQIWDFWSATGGNTNSVFNLINCFGFTYGHIPASNVTLVAYQSPNLIQVTDGPRVTAVNFRGGLIFDGTSLTNFTEALSVSDGNPLVTDSRLQMVGGFISSWTNDYSYTNSKVNGNYVFRRGRVNIPVNNQFVELTSRSGLELKNADSGAKMVFRKSLVEPTKNTLSWDDDISSTEMIVFGVDRITTDSLYAWAGRGDGLTNLPNGAVALPTSLSNVVNLASNNYVGTFVGDGMGLTNLNPTNIVAGTLTLASVTTSNLDVTGTITGRWIDGVTGWTNGEAWLRPTTNLWGQTNVTQWEITNETFQVTLVPGTYKYDVSLYVETASTTAGFNTFMSTVGTDYISGSYVRARANSSTVTWIDKAATGTAGMVVASQDAAQTRGIGFGSGLLIVTATNIYRVSLYQRTTTDTANRPLLMTNSFMYFKKLP